MSSIPEYVQLPLPGEEWALPPSAPTDESKWDQDAEVIVIIVFVPEPEMTP